MLHLPINSFTLIWVKRACLPSCQSCSAHYFITPLHGGTCRVTSIFTFVQSTVLSRLHSTCLSEVSTSHYVLIYSYTYYFLPVDLLRASTGRAI